MNRVDLAEKIVRKMQTKNEDSLACQLASAECYLAQVIHQSVLYSFYCNNM